MKKKNRILVLGLTFSMVISSGSLTGCDSAAGNMGKETTGVEYEEADYELSEESCSDSGIDAADPGTVDNETEKTAENRTDAEKSTETEESQTDNSTDSGLWKKASTTPYGKYPELVTYTLGQMSGANNSNLPAGNTYEDSAYTRYLKEILNVQNENAYMEREDRYDEYVNVLVNDHTLPDVLVVSDRETLNVLVENDMVEDLTEVYANCTSPRIKAMYNSYGPQLLGAGTFDGKLMALPEAVIDHGPCLLWMRKDWMDQLGLAEPKTLEEAMDIIQVFQENRMGAEEGEDPVGLVCDTNFVSTTSQNYSVEPVFEKFYSYPRRWIKDKDGEIVYGSLTEETRSAVAYLHELYERGILDQNFALRAQNNLRDLVVEGKCGAFFGLWWAPNNPLANAVSRNPDADWQPYLIATDSDGTTSYHSQNPCYKYVVVRKGYEHPEIAAKMISVMFDKVRFDCTDSEEFKNYYQINVEPTARPLSINVDYNNALSICYRNIDAAISGRKNPDSLELLERSFYDACSEYIKNANKTSTQWAAYMSRIKACSLIAQDNIKVVDSLYFKTTDTMKSHWWRLKAKEKEAYLKIISGEEDISYFDTFVKEWNEQGGQTITSEVSQSMK